MLNKRDVGAVASSQDVADWEQAAALIDLAIDTFGDLHVLVNNAGILRDRTVAKLMEADQSGDGHEH